MKYCMYCGKDMPDEAKFCHRCGKEFITNGGNNTGVQYNNTLEYSMVPKPAVDNNVPKAITIASIALYALGYLLPYFTANYLGTTETISALDANDTLWTIIVYVVLIAGLVKAILNKPDIKGYTLYMGVVLFINLIWDYVSVKKNMKEEYGEYVSSLLSVGAGFYVLVAAGVGFLIAGIIYKTQKDKNN